MNIVILRSRRDPEQDHLDERYLCRSDTRFAERVLGNLRGDISYCTACGPDCTFCREPYHRQFGDDIAAVIDFPSVLPYVLEQPAAYVPASPPMNDVLLVIAIHEQILLEVLKTCAAWGTKGVVVPLEAPGWICGATRARAHEICEAAGIEIAFPKPFCAFRPPKGGVLADFREHFHIGCPEMKLAVDNGKITAADVVVSAACGATYCVARWLVDRRLSENIEIEVVSKRWHAFPCTASMERDPELHGETPLHVAGQAHYATLAPYKKVAGLEREWAVSPLGTTVQKPVPPEENLARIEDAKSLVMAELSSHAGTSIADLKKIGTVTPAALHSALLILKREGKIRVKGSEVLAPKSVPPPEEQKAGGQSS